MRFQHLLRAFEGIPWALLPSKLAELRSVLLLHAAGERLTAEEIEARIGKPQPQGAGSRAGSIAILPVYGVLSQRMNLMTAMSGGTSTELLGADLRAAVKNPDVRGIILDIDSPGGSTWGIDELASELFAARSQKPLWAVANSLAASAAYWLGSQAARFYAMPGGDVGSIGIWTAHTDSSKADEQAGQKVTVISAGKYKAEANGHEPLSEEARAAIQERVDDAYEQFVAAVARGRGVDADAVRSGFGEGRIVSARRAVGLGMIDGLATLDQVIATMQRELEAAGSGWSPAAAGSGQAPVAAGVVADQGQPGSTELLRLRNETAKRRRMT